MTSFGRNCKVCEAKHLEVGDSLLTKNGLRKIASIRSFGMGDCCDISVLRDGGTLLGEPNFILGNGVISHNCNLPIVSQCLRLIEKNRGIPVSRSDIPIDDRNTIFFASKKDLVGIFQLDNPSTKPVVDDVGMESLMDIAVVTSLIRPGPRDMGMDKEYARRKRGEPYDAPEIMKRLLPETYGIVVFQEQAMVVAQKIAGFSPTESYKFLKAIAKKHKDLMASFKSKFFDGAKPRIESGEMTADDVEATWNLLEKFCRYAFNQCIDGDTLIQSPNGKISIVKIREATKAGQSVRLFSYNGSTCVGNDCDEVIDCGEVDAYEIVLDDDSRIVCSMNHKFLCRDGEMHSVQEIIEKHLDMVSIA